MTNSIMKNTFAIKSKNIITANGQISGAVIITDHIISDVVTELDNNFKGPIQDVGESVVMPGLIDCHVHINEPGRTEWEGFETATKAAAAGGITTLIEMPLNASPVTTSAKNFEIKLKATENKLAVNCGFWGGVVPDNLNDLDELLESGVFGLKAFLTHSGIDDFPNTSAHHLRKALAVLKKKNMPLLVHCELDEPNKDEILLTQTPRSYQAYLKSRPKEWENKAVKLMIDLCRETAAKVHIVHVSSAEAVPLIAAAKKEGLPISAETCPHYLFFNAEEIPDGATTFKCAPPIREKENNEKLWEALSNGTIDFVVTDHSPAPPNLKEIETGDFKKAWGGIAGLQFSLPVMWTAARKRGVSVETISKWMCSNVANFMQLNKQKGKIEKGFDADIVVWNPNKQFKVTTEMIQHRHKITPYKGLDLFGVVEQTYVNGSKIFDGGKMIHLNQGKILLSSNPSS